MLVLAKARCLITFIVVPWVTLPLESPSPIAATFVTCHRRDLIEGCSTPEHPPVVRLLPSGLRRLRQSLGDIAPVRPRRVRPAERTTPGGQHLVISHPLQTAAARRIPGMTRPGLRGRMLHESASHRVEVHVSGHRPEIGLIFHQFGSIAALENMPSKAVSPRPSIGITGQKRLHAASEVGLRSLEDDVQVVDMMAKA